MRAWTRSSAHTQRSAPPSGFQLGASAWTGVGETLGYLVVVRASRVLAPLAVHPNDCENGFLTPLAHLILEQERDEEAARWRRHMRRRLVAYCVAYFVVSTSCYTVILAAAR